MPKRVEYLSPLFFIRAAEFVSLPEDNYRFDYERIVDPETKLRCIVFSKERTVGGIDCEVRKYEYGYLQGNVSLGGVEWIKYELSIDDDFLFQFNLTRAPYDYDSKMTISKFRDHLYDRRTLLNMFSAEKNRRPMYYTEPLMIADAKTIVRHRASLMLGLPTGWFEDIEYEHMGKLV